MLKKLGLFLGPILFLIVYNLPFEVLSSTADDVIAVAIWMVIWWITEAVSISVTSLIPLIFFPMLEIMDLKTVAANYGSPIVFLFFGGFVMALGLEKVELHKRIALNIIKWTGTTPDKVILGFMLATAFLSMWISNTATTVVMLPIALSVIQLLIDDEDGFTTADKNFALALMLSIAYSANVGGIATIIGTPPNTVMAGFVAQEYQIDISFLKWMLMGVPFSLMMIIIVYIVLVKWVYPNGLGAKNDSKEIIQHQLEVLGPIDPREKRVLIVFFMAMFCWIFRTTINEAISFIQLSDTGISLLAAFCLFAIPLDISNHRFILEWNDTQKLPWGILILFGGGLALASALSHVGLIDYIGAMVASKEGYSPMLISFLLIAIMLFMTELMSNVALVTIFAPVIAGVALGLDQEILHLLIPITISASCAFMLPMATPPNAIVFASGHIKVGDMVRVGLFLNVISIMAILLFSRWLIPLLF